MYHIKLTRYLLVVFLLLIFITEGTGMRFGNIFAFHLVLSLPLFLILCNLVTTENKTNKLKILVPIPQSLLFCFFILGSILSTFYSLDIQKSFEQTLIYSAFFLIYILTYNVKSSILKPFSFLSFALSAFFIVFSIYLATLPEEALFRMKPWENFQYIYSYFRTSHPLGAIMIFPVSLCIPFVFNNNRYRKLFTATFIGSLIVLLFTFMRSSLVAVGVSLAIYALIRVSQVKFRRSAGILLLISSVLIVIVTGLSVHNKTSYVFQQINPFGLTLEHKDIFQSRLEYFRQAIIGFSNHPIIGNGPNTFDIVSRTYSYGLRLTDISAHNLILDVLSDTGLFGMFFIAFILFVLAPRIYDLRKENSLQIQGLILTGASVFILYQAFRFHRYTSHVLYFILVLALITKAKNHWEVSKKYIVITSVILFLASQSIFLSTITLKMGNKNIAALLYPLNKSAYATDEILTTNTNMPAEQINLYSRLVENDYYKQHEIGRYYLSQEKKQLALLHLKKSYALYPMQIFPKTVELYELIEQVEGRKSAIAFFTSYLDYYNQAVTAIPNNIRYDDGIKALCEKQHLSC